MMITHCGWLCQLQKSSIFVSSTWASIFIGSKPYVLLDYEGVIKTSSSLSHLSQAVSCGSVPPKPGLSVLSSPTDSYHILVTSDSVLLCSHLRTKDAPRSWSTKPPASTHPSLRQAPGLGFGAAGFGPSSSPCLTADAVMAFLARLCW